MRSGERKAAAIAASRKPRALSASPISPAAFATLALAAKVSPTPVRSDIGVPDAIAPGSGSLSCFARSTISSVSAPPAIVLVVFLFLWL